MQVATQVVSEIKDAINTRDLLTVQEYYKELETTDIFDQMDPAYLFQKAYLHSCLKGCQDISSWFEKEIYPTLPEISRISIAQVFSYGRHLLRQANQRHK